MWSQAPLPLQISIYHLRNSSEDPSALTGAPAQLQKEVLWSTMITRNFPFVSIHLEESSNSYHTAKKLIGIGRFWWLEGSQKEPESRVSVMIIQRWLTGHPVREQAILSRLLIFEIGKKTKGCYFCCNCSIQLPETDISHTGKRNMA